jgi:hypothetical protein
MTYRKVVAFGDSFTRGDELADSKLPSSIEPYSHSKLTWPALVADNCPYECYAVGGIGNQWISWKVTSLLRKLQNCLVIVNWTWFERFDYVDVIDKSWATAHPRITNDVNHFFYKHIDSDVWNLFRNLQQIHSTICLLEQNNIKFLMTCLDPMLYKKAIYPETPSWQNGHQDPTSWQHEHRDAAVELQKEVMHYIINFYGFTFAEWTKHKKFEIGPGGHPLQKAHAEAAKYINMVTTEGKNNGH